VHCFSCVKFISRGASSQYPQYPPRLPVNMNPTKVLCICEVETTMPSYRLLSAAWRRYMSIATALQQLLEVEESRQGGAYSPSTTCVGVSRLGAQDQQIVVGTMEQLQQVDFGPPLHSLVIAGGCRVGHQGVGVGEGGRCQGGQEGGRGVGGGWSARRIH
jgi:hypothetical protein